MTEISEQRWHDVLEQLRAVVARRGVRGADIDDVVQTAVEKAIRNLRTLADEERFEPWLKRIAANAALDQMRSVQRKGLYEELDKADNVAGEVDDADPLIDFVDCIEPFLTRLAPADAGIIRARDIDGGSYPELAADLGLSVAGVKSRVQRARLRLSEQLVACCAVLGQSPIRHDGEAACAPDCCGQGGEGDAARRPHDPGKRS